MDKSKGMGTGNDVGTLRGDESVRTSGAIGRCKRRIAIPRVLLGLIAIQAFFVVLSFREFPDAVIGYRDEFGVFKTESAMFDELQQIRQLEGSDGESRKLELIQPVRRSEIYALDLRWNAILPIQWLTYSFTVSSWQLWLVTSLLILSIGFVLEKAIGHWNMLVLVAVVQIVFAAILQCVGVMLGWQGGFQGTLPLFVVFIGVFASMMLRGELKFEDEWWMEEIADRPAVARTENQGQPCNALQGGLGSLEEEQRGELELAHQIDQLLSEGRLVDGASAIERYLHLYQSGRVEFQLLLLNVWLRLGRYEQILEFADGIHRVFLEPSQVSELDRVVLSARSRMRTRQV
jgi:hypothetical protein